MKKNIPILFEFFRLFVCLPPADGTPAKAGIQIKSEIFKPNQYNKGIITFPFLFVVVIILFLSLSFLILTMTLSHVTVTQYMTYSSARKLSLAGLNPRVQLDGAISHYETLRGRFFKPSAYTGPGDWFYIQEKLRLKEQQDSIARDYPFRNQNRFYGINTGFQAQALNLKIPFLIEQEGNQIKDPVRVSSFLGREPSQEECRSFHENRVKEIKDLCNPTDCPNITKPKVLKGDNGC